jgi:hypothetical protein
LVRSFRVGGLPGAMFPPSCWGCVRSGCSLGCGRCSSLDIVCAWSPKSLFFLGFPSCVQPTYYSPDLRKSSCNTALINYLAWSYGAEALHITYHRQERVQRE